MDEFFSSLTIESIVLFAINFFLILIILFISISNRNKIKKLKKKYYKFMDGLGEANIEQLVEKCLNDISVVSKKNRELELNINNIERKLIDCIQKLGIIRYNAFDDVGSDLSFSVALLDNSDDGVIISSIYSRDSSITYAKPIIGSKSKYTLSAEELQAIDLAKKSNR